MIEVGQSAFKDKTKVTTIKNMPLFKLTYEKFFMIKNMNDYSKRAKTMYYGKQNFHHGKEESENNHQIMSKNEATLLLREDFFQCFFRIGLIK
jgi:hypothetical protein